MTDRVDPFNIKGSDGVVRGLDEHYDTMKDVSDDPYGAWLAIQNLWIERDALKAENKRLREALTEIERLYYMEGREVRWRAAHMCGEATRALAQTSTPPRDGV